MTYGTRPSTVLGQHITSGVHVKRLDDVSMVPGEEEENTIQTALSKISTQLVVYTARNHSHQGEVIYLERNSTSAMSDSPIALRHNHKWLPSATRKKKDGITSWRLARRLASKSPGAAQRGVFRRRQVFAEIAVPWDDLGMGGFASFPLHQ